MKKINTKQLYKLIEGKVRKALLSENMYDDYEYFWNDGTGGRDVNPYPYGTEMGDSDNWKELERQAQIDSDWDDLEKLNKKYAGSKNPVLASKYNHNVEDGRENAEAYASGLYEKKLERAIMKNINETLMRIANN